MWFGKTEVAIRAAFKAVDSNKLSRYSGANNHISVLRTSTTFTERLKDMPVSWLFKPIQNGQTKKAETLSEGKARYSYRNTSIGQKCVFKDLGLLIGRRTKFRECKRQIKQ
jgi:transcription-repair coupling factor (superfamily II helicase)